MHGRIYGRGAGINTPGVKCTGRATAGLKNSRSPERAWEDLWTRSGNKYSRGDVHEEGYCGTNNRSKKIYDFVC